MLASMRDMVRDIREHRDTCKLFIGVSQRWYAKPFHSAWAITVYRMEIRSTDNAPILHSWRVCDDVEDEQKIGALRAAKRFAELQQLPFLAGAAHGRNMAEMFVENRFGHDRTHIVMSRATKAPGSNATRYKKVAIVKLEPGFVGEPKMISERARGVAEIVKVWDHLYVGTTDRCAYREALAEAKAECKELNDELG